MELIAVVRVRGRVGVNARIEKTLEMLGLRRVNNCALLPPEKSYTGMLNKVKDYVTWGEISDETLRKLLEKKLKGKDVGKLVEEIKKEGPKVLGKNKFFRLKPPVKGYKSVKKPFPKGALGYRGDKINDLIGRMLYEEKGV